jgi:POT family proton-dependent oligopeptide transporter
MNPPLTHAGAGAATTADTAFFGHPRGLSTLFFAEMWERFSYYGMRAFLILYMTTPVAAGGLAMADADATSIYGTYTGAAWGASILGGILADRWLGQYRSVLLGGVLIMLGHFSLVFRDIGFFYAGLALIVIGTGLLKPSVSTLVGSLYAEGDARRDSGFSIFYMGINIGAIAGPLAAGYLAQKVDWHIGFAAAGVGMALGLTQLLLGRRYVQVAIDRIAAGIAARSPAAGTGAAAMEAPSGATAGFTAAEWKRLAAIGVFILCGVLFFAGFEQQGSSMNLFAERYTRLEVLGFSFPASWFQSVPPVFVVMFVPLFTWIWARLGDREPSIAGKFALGLLFMALAMLVMTPAGAMAQSGEGIRVSPWWLVLSFALAEFGEICLYPVGMSAVTKLSPPRIVGLMMGVWFLALAFGSKLAGWVAGFIESMPLESIFTTLGGVLLAASVVMALLIKPVSRLSGEAK